MRKLFVLLVFAFMSWSAPTTTASADTICKDYRNYGYSGARTYFLAKHAARKAWKLKVRRLHGQRWASWWRARSKSYDCKRTHHKLRRCIAKARACRRG